MGAQICLAVRLGTGFHSVEVEVLLQPVLYLCTELFPDACLPCLFATLIVAGVHRQHKEEIHVVVEQEQRVAVIQAVVELPLHIAVVPAVSLLDTVLAVAQLLVHRGGDEEVGDDVVTLGLFVAQFHTARRLFAVVEDVEVPLYHVPCVGVLLVDALTPQLVAHLVIFRVAYVIGVTRVALYQALGGIEVVHYLAVILLFLHAVGQRIVAYQRIDNGLEHNVETLHQQVFLLVNVYRYLTRRIKESVAECP